MRVRDVLAHGKLIQNYGRADCRSLANVKIRMERSGTPESMEADAALVQAAMQAALKDGAEIPPLTLMMERPGSPEPWVVELPEDTFPAVHRETNRIRLFARRPPEKSAMSAEGVDSFTPAEEVPV